MLIASACATLFVLLVPRSVLAASAGMCGPHANTQTAPLPNLQRPEASLDAIDDQFGCGSEVYDHLLTQGEGIPSLGDAVTDMCSCATWSFRTPPCDLVEWPPSEAGSLGSARSVRVDRPPR